MQRENDEVFTRAMSLLAATSLAVCGAVMQSPEPRSASEYPGPHRLSVAQASHAAPTVPDTNEPAHAAPTVPNPSEPTHVSPAVPGLGGLTHASPSVPGAPSHASPTVPTLGGGR